jgi:hypothetical protein
MVVVMVTGEGSEKFAGKLRKELLGIFKNKNTSPPDGLSVITTRQCVISGKYIIVYCGKPDKDISGGFAAIVEESNNEAAAQLASCGLPAISCGINEKNTVTISSNDLDKIQVCLQRSVTGLNGQTIEPGEFVFESGKETGYTFLAAATIFLLVNGQYLQ